MPTVGPLLDNAQILPRIYDPTKNTIGVANITGQLVPKVYDSLQISYYTSGFGIGQPQTVIYLQGGQSGTVVATMQLTYNSSGQVATVTVT